MRTFAAAAIASAIGLASSAQAGNIIQYNFEITSPPGDSNGGVIDTISSAFRPADNHFEWTVRFSNQVSQGYTLALSPGPNPKGTSGELALLYFDATNIGAPIVSVYGYNGLNNPSSFNDGSQAAGIQTPDRIVSSLVDASFIMEASVVDDGLGGRTMTLIMDATAVQDYVVINTAPDPDTEWTGLAYGEGIGIWFHPFRNLNTGYHANGAGEGYLSAWSGTQGWYDTSDETTTTTFVPAPGSAALIALSGLLVARRKRD